MCVSQGITELNGDHCQKINKTFIVINYVILFFFFLVSRRVSEQNLQAQLQVVCSSRTGALHSRRSSEVFSHQLQPKTPSAGCYITRPDPPHRIILLVCTHLSQKTLTTSAPRRAGSLKG